MSKAWDGTVSDQQPMTLAKLMETLKELPLPLPEMRAALTSLAPRPPVMLKMRRTLAPTQKVDVVLVNPADYAAVLEASAGAWVSWWDPARVFDGLEFDLELEAR